MKNTQTKNCILRVLQGAIIGAGAILPGISGGVLAVIFGIYRPAMELLTHPKRAFPRYWRMLLAVGIGVDNETLPFQRVLYNHGEGLFILNQQYFYFIHDILIFLVILVYVISVCTPGIYSCFS